MNRRILIAIALIITTAAILVIGIAARHVTQPAVTVPTSVTYTNAVTGTSANDIIGEITNLAPNTIDRAGVTIDGIDGMYPYMTTGQAVNAQGVVSDFLMARSGLANVHAAMEGNTITQTGNQISFTIDVIKPQVKYQVIITINNTYQTVPDVTINRVGA